MLCSLSSLLSHYLNQWWHTPRNRLQWKNIKTNKFWLTTFHLKLSSVIFSAIWMRWRINASVYLKLISAHGMGIQMLNIIEVLLKTALIRACFNTWFLRVWRLSFMNLNLNYHFIIFFPVLYSHWIHVISGVCHPCKHSIMWQSYIGQTWFQSSSAT